jgi:hypothetical protein
MSRAQIELFLRTIRDEEGFAAQVGSDASIMNGYAMTPAEREAILAADADALRALGVDEALLPALEDVAGPGGPGTSPAP